MLVMFCFKKEEQLWAFGNIKQHLRFLSTDGPLVPITTSAEVLLLGSHDLLERADIGSDRLLRVKRKCSINRQVNFSFSMENLNVIHM